MILYFIITLLILLLIPYIICPVYDFNEPKVFQGNNLYNPYSNIRQGSWYKANFHSHSRVYFGITNGSSSFSDSIYSTYKRIGYYIPGISNYMSICKDMEGKEGYIPIYEHGMGIFKNHYLVVGADKVKPIDFVFYQTNNNQQYLINQIKTENNLVSIVHPEFRYTVTKEDIATLSNYDCLEIFRHDREYLTHFDYALSAGKDIKILANDDCHEITNEYEVGMSINFINSKSSSQSDIIGAIKNGSNIGISLKECGFSTFSLKEQNISKLPKLKNFEVRNDSIKLSFDSKAAEIKFIGQNGAVKSTHYNSDEGYYIFQPDDTYIRTEVIFDNKAKYELNPVFRYDNNTGNATKLSINIFKSILYYLIWTALIILIVVRVKKKYSTKVR